MDLLIKKTQEHIDVKIEEKLSFYKKMYNKNDIYYR